MCVLPLCAITLFHVGDIYRCICDGTASDQHFAITAKVSCVTAVETVCGDFEFAVEDDTDAVNMFYDKDIGTHPVPGDTILAQGILKRRRWDRRPYASITALKVLAHGPAPTPLKTTVREMAEGRVDCRYCRLHATVREVAPSPYKPGFAYLTAVDDGCIISIWARAAKAECDSLRGLIGKEVDILGFCTPVNISELKFIGRQIRIYDTANIRPTPSATPARQIPPTDKIGNLRPAEIDALGLHSATGCVCAVWRGRNVLLKRSAKDYLQVELLDSTPPNNGDIVEVIGFPESNLFRVNLINARWRKISSSRPPADRPVYPLSSKLFRDSTDNHWPLRISHGDVIRTSGRIVSLPKDGKSDSLVIENDITSLNVETRLLDPRVAQLLPGSVIEVTGVCVVEAEARSLIGPKFKSATIVPRSPADVRILSTPSWWTQQRLLFVISGLLSCLIGILIWNAALRRASLRKGHQLAREQLKRAKAQLKTEERTRLAVELHDSLAQNLTGVSLEVDSVLQLNDNLGSESLHHLTIASRALQSCCTELRNSIWDLRNEFLDIPDMTAAIRQTVSPHIGNATLKIRFNVSRKALDENLVHAILRIIRELSINAVRHGEATVIRIAGSLDGHNILFCVNDNGRGFDPDKAPGITEGHFGLQGIRERIKDFDGQLTTDSAPGKGTRITIRVKTTNHD